jgi:hypothetical protein
MKKLVFGARDSRPLGAARARRGAGDRLCLCPHGGHAHVSADCQAVGTCVRGLGRRDRRSPVTGAQGRVVSFHFSA